MGAILRSIPATVSPDGSVTLSAPVELSGPAIAMVTLIIETDERQMEPALLSEAALDDWNRTEEDEAWAYLSEVI
jgi:hypothetical protein